MKRPKKLLYYEEIFLKTDYESLQNQLLEDVNDVFDLSHSDRLSTKLWFWPGRPWMWRVWRDSSAFSLYFERPGIDRGSLKVTFNMQEYIQRQFIAFWTICGVIIIAGLIFLPLFLIFGYVILVIMCLALFIFWRQEFQKAFKLLVAHLESLGYEVSWVDLKMDN